MGSGERGTRSVSAERVKLALVIMDLSSDTSVEAVNFLSVPRMDNVIKRVTSD